MNPYELKETEKLVIKAIENYLNSNQYELDRKIISAQTSAYYLLDRYKDMLIDRVYKKEEKLKD